MKKVVEKLNIQKTRLLLHMNRGVPSDEYPGHVWQKCNYVPNEDVCIVLDNLPDLENSISDISGYVSKNIRIWTEVVSKYLVPNAVSGQCFALSCSSS